MLNGIVYHGVFRNNVFIQLTDLYPPLQTDCNIYMAFYSQNIDLSQKMGPDFRVCSGRGEYPAF